MLDPLTSRQALGLAVQARRHEIESTQEMLANDTGLHQRWISNVETGKRNPSYASLKHLATGLDLAASELIGRAEKIEHNTPARSRRRAAARK